MSSSEGAHKPALLEAAAALREVHKVLVRAVRMQYENEGHHVEGPGHLLRLLTEDPYFAWLHPMSELIVDLDALLAQELLPAGTVAAVRMEVDRLSRAGDAPFWEKYAPLLQSEPQVAVAHGRLRQAIKALPASADEPHERKQWVTPRVHAKRSTRS
jgi:hypothetical protein